MRCSTARAIRWRTALGVIAPMVVFTSGGSEANNMALKGIAVERLLVSAIEHPSVLEAQGPRAAPVEADPGTASGVVDLECPGPPAAGPRALISVMLANNETGIVQPVRDVVALAQPMARWFTPMRCRLSARSRSISACSASTA